jgi:hypothetical protein
MGKLAFKCRRDKPSWGVIKLSNYFNAWYPNPSVKSHIMYWARNRDHTRPPCFGQARKIRRWNLEELCLPLVSSAWTKQAFNAAGTLGDPRSKQRLDGIEDASPSYPWVLLHLIITNSLGYTPEIFQHLGRGARYSDLTSVAISDGFWKREMLWVLGRALRLNYPLHPTGRRWKPDEVGMSSRIRCCGLEEPPGSDGHRDAPCEAIVCMSSSKLRVLSQAVIRLWSSFVDSANRGASLKFFGSLADKSRGVWDEQKTYWVWSIPFCQRTNRISLVRL